MRRMITGKLIEWIKSLKDKIHQNGNTTEIGGNVEVDGDLQVNSSILDSEGDEAIDIGTSDISIHKNVNIGSVDEPEDLFVSGEMEVDEASTIGVNLTAKIQEIAGGGGSGKYAHFITVYSATYGWNTFLYISNRSNEYTISDFATELYNEGYRNTDTLFYSNCGVGIKTTDGQLGHIVGVYSSSPSQNLITLSISTFIPTISGTNITYTAASTTDIANAVVSDKVIAL